MAQLADHYSTLAPNPAAPRVRSVPVTQCLVWLRRGAADMRRVPNLSLACGALVALAGMFLLAITRDATYLAPALIGGFLLVAPFVAAVFYGLSRQLEQGETPNLGAALHALRRNPGATAMFGLGLTLGLMIWARTSALMFALFSDGAVPDMTQPFHDLLLSGHYLGLTAAFVALGAVIASVVFSFGVVTTPLLTDREQDLFTAMLTSVRCCRANPAPMALWAAMIAAMIFLLGFGTLMIGLVVVFPLLGHASWHAYRDMVE